MGGLWTPVDSSDQRVRDGLRRMMDARSAAVSRGERPAGWKISWNAPAVRDRLGVSSSVIGFVLESRILPADAPYPLSGTTRPAAEVELALRAGPDATIAAAGPGIEIIDVHGEFGDVEAALAANVWQHGAVLGDMKSWSGTLLDGVEVHVEHDGEPFADPADPRAVLEDPEAVVRFVAGTLEPLGETLREGDLILSGLLLPGPVPAEPGGRVSADFGPLGGLDIEFGE
jgi:2-keto-4-pentenoate hydratase